METYTKNELFGEPDFDGLKAVAGRPHDGLYTTVCCILGLPDTKRLIITTDIMRSDRSVNHNKKHLPVLDITDAPGLTPTHKVQAAYTSTKRYRRSGYGWKQDGKLITVPIVKILDGSALFAYEMQRPDWQDDVDTYAATPLAQEQGVRAIVTVSSRREKERRHKVRLKGVGALDWKLVKSEEIDCEDGLYRDLAYNTPEERKTFCAHEVAAYYKLALKLKGQGDATAARMSPFAFPSQGMIDLYKRMTRQAQVEYYNSQGKQRRPLNEIEMEALLTTYVAEQVGPGFGMQGKLAERDWR